MRLDFSQQQIIGTFIIKEIERPNVSRAWFIIDGKRRIMMWQDLNGKVCCNCGAYYNGECDHKTAVREYNGDGNSSKVLDEHGSEYARLLQVKEEEEKRQEGKTAKQQLPSCHLAILPPSHHQREGKKTLIASPLRHSATHPLHRLSVLPFRRLSKQPVSKLDITDPFQQSEQLDIDQIEGRANGELVHKLSNGEYVISYCGIMRLAEKHDIEFSLMTHDDTNTIIAKARRNGSERVSGKPINGSVSTAGELAKRNAARQLLPLVEIKTLEHKSRLAADFSWETAKAKCVELMGTEANVDITIHLLVKADKLRQDNPSGYNKTEWLMIRRACHKEATISHDLKSLNRWSHNSPAFIKRCEEAIEKVRADGSKVVNEQSPDVPDGTRRLQMDKKLRTWLIEADDTRKAISCCEIAAQFDSYQKGIITRLRAGIDSGADISTVELD